MFRIETTRCGTKGSESINAVTYLSPTKTLRVRLSPAVDPNGQVEGEEVRSILPRRPFG
jgi:hypothetical protein